MTHSGGGETLAQRLALALHEIGALQFGSFTLKSGKQSPFYIDLRLLVSYPWALALSAQALAALAAPLTYDRLCALPYAALPIGTALALQLNRPLIYPRKERKEYGTARQIEGLYHAGERALVIDDVITTGGAKLEAIAPLREAGLIVEAVAVLIDRQPPGSDALAAAGVRLYAALNLVELLDILHEAGRIDAAQRRVVLDWAASMD
jgi:uridine monophosphate synthetase